MRGEIFGLEQRRQWPDEDKLGIVISVGVDGTTVPQLAQRHDVTRQRVYTWRRELSHWTAVRRSFRCSFHPRKNFWTYVRDQRPWSGTAPPGAVYYFALDWKEAQVQSHLKNAKGIFQADGYKGFAKLYEPGLDWTSRFREAACLADLRRDF